MDMSEVEQVFKFLRKNGLTDAESAFIEEIKEKKPELSSFDFDKFLFPTMPPPPNLKILTTRPSAKVPGSDHGSSNDSSQDEFVSFDSSTARLCSTEFTNPYGVRATTRPSSRASPDRMSQFRTARDCPDSHMLDDRYWYKEKDKFINEEMQALYNSNCLTKESSSTYHSNGSNSISDLNGYLPNKNFSLEDYKQWFGIILESDSEACEKRTVTSDELSFHDNKKIDYEIFHLRVIHRKDRTGLEKSKDLPITVNQVIAGRYYVVGYIHSSSFTKVVHARDLHTGMDVCLKILKNAKDCFDRSLDEIKILKLVNKKDPEDKCHIISLYDYFYHQEHMFIVTELLGINLYEFQNFNREADSEPYFTLSRLQVITLQCLEALKFLHGLGITHCDMKPENILIKSDQRCEIKVIDLGSSCFEGDEMSLYLQSRSYRAPEVILGLPYDKKIDIWSLGCILSELYSGDVLFPNVEIVMILARVIGMFGAIDMEMLVRGKDTHKYFTRDYDLYLMDEETYKLEFIMPEESSLKDHLQSSDPVFISFFEYLLQVNPKQRPTATEALQHPWLRHSY